MKTKKSSKVNRLSLQKVINILDKKNINYTIFFGTLLGFTRDNDVIDGDDDIDILLDCVYFQKIEDEFIKCGYKKTEYYSNGNFIQFEHFINDEKVTVDFYFYSIFDNENVIDKWNFFGKPHDKEKHLLIPKTLLFPFKQLKNKDMVISMPNKHIEICVYLYGDKYQTKMKRWEYKIDIIKNKPMIKYDK